MPFNIYRGGCHLSPSEIEILTPIIHKLQNQYSESEDFCYLFAGYICGPKQIDATLIRSNAIINIEIKDYSGERAVADSQGNISVHPSNVFVNKDRGESPFEQVRYQNYAIKNFIFEKRSNLFGNDLSQNIINADKVDVCGFIVFRSIKSFDMELLRHHKAYFRLADVESFVIESDKYHGRDFLTNGPWIQLGEQFGKTLAKLLGLAIKDTIAEPETTLPSTVE